MWRTQRMTTVVRVWKNRTWAGKTGDGSDDEEKGCANAKRDGKDQTATRVNVKPSASARFGTEYQTSVHFSDHVYFHELILLSHLRVGKHRYLGIHL